MHAVPRLIDVNVNRAREALRVLEEVARYVLEDEGLTQRLKSLRHGLVAATEGAGGGLGRRDVAGDLGTGLTTEREFVRASVGEVAAAAESRLSEALRVLEEFLKIDHPPVASEMERLRYAAYDVARDVRCRLVRRAPCDWRVCVLLTEAQCAGGDWRRAAEAVVRGGADALQLREPDCSARELLARARWLRECTAGRAHLIINDRPDVAMRSDADGVHVGQLDLPVRDVRALVGQRMIVGVSTSRLEEAQAAAEAGADYCGVGPMFATSTKRKDFIAGPEALRRLTEWGRLPHLAIGGVTTERVEDLAHAGIRAVAVCAAVLHAADPALEVRRFREALERAASPGVRS